MGKWPSQKKGKREGKERKGKSKGVETSFPNPTLKEGNDLVYFPPLPRGGEGRGDMQIITD
jgi:hypothetical protein